MFAASKLTFLKSIKKVCGTAPIVSPSTSAANTKSAVTRTNLPAPS